MPAAYPIDTDQIVITASRVPEEAARTPASVTIIDDEAIERLGNPLLPSLLRLTPSAAVTVSGPAGSFAEIRFRGAEANHSLLFMDGIKVNDPASGDIPRFELLNADLASRIEVVRGPQSALWGSDAIGGVVAVNGLDDPTGWEASAEAGSFGTRQASASGGMKSGAFAVGGGIGWQRADGIDSFGLPGGDEDGYRNLSGRVRATYDFGGVTLGGAALALSGRSQFDGYDPLTFEHTDTLDESRNRLAAGSTWVDIGDSQSDWAGRIALSALTSTNRNYLDRSPLNRTRGTRLTYSGQLERRLKGVGFTHRLIVAAEGDREAFRARGDASGLPTDQDVDRSHHGITAEYRADSERLTLDLAVRRDLFNRFRDATTLRAAGRFTVGGGFALKAGYAEGIAPPTFFDLYGFYPGLFIGNTSLRPERSKGFELGGDWRKGRFRAALTVYRQRLSDEIVDVIDPTTFFFTSANRDGRSHRAGIEAEIGWRLAEALRLSANYAYLKADEPDGDAGSHAAELRRPKHSGALIADGSIGRWAYGASLAYAGARRDRRDNYPYDRVRLGGYWLADARIAYRVKGGLELFARGANLFDADYQETFGYRTEGRGLFLGIKLGDRRSSP